jgi:hypothetical protein
MSSAALKRILAVLVTAALLIVSVAHASQSPKLARNGLSVVSHVKPRLTLRPTIVTPGDRLTFIGSGFRRNEKVWLGVGPPQSEASFWGSARTNNTGAFRKALTVNRRVKPGRWVALACQRGCRIKAGASFRSVSGRG